MKRGLVIGKFMPVHEGHCALIRFAAAHCDELIVSLSFKADDPIPGSVRGQWLKEIFKAEPTITIETSLDNFDDESLAMSERMTIWTSFIQKRFPAINIVFSSEDYGEPLARSLGIVHLPFDPDRILFPVSASQVRAHPFQHWQFIPKVVRPYFVKRVCLYGPESTGKSSMAVRLAEYYHTAWVPEVARELITTNQFTLEDIERIGYAQVARTDEKMKVANKILFCDTDLITTEIYSQYYLNKVPPILYDLQRQIPMDYYFFFEIDVPWVDDGMRDLKSPDQRRAMRDRFEKALTQRKLSYFFVKGTWQERFEGIVRHIDQWLEHS